MPPKLNYDLIQTTMRLPAPVWDRLKADAAEKGQTITVWVHRAIMAALPKEKPPE